MTFCLAKQWLLDHMPEFDKYFMPPSVTVPGRSMFEDNIAFAVMADNASKWSSNIPLGLKLGYLLPYATFQESRTNWRPLLFAKFFQLVASSTSTVSAMQRLVSPAFPHNPYTNWTAFNWPTSPLPLGNTDFYLQWASSTSPPVVSPFEFAAYGYGSCSAWSSLVTYVARSVGIPARIVGTPCWNTGQFAGLAKDNPRVHDCWNGGDGTTYGGAFLNNHNWVEYWDDVNAKWVFLNVPTTTDVPDGGLCDPFSESHGCGYDVRSGCKNASPPGLASQDHEIFSVTWNMEGDVPGLEGGPLVDVVNLKLTSGESVSPFVWSPKHTSPIGIPLNSIGVRVVNRTEFYRCKE
uniref:Transglutaminase-like domain-containing protein n=1 Tax=Arcella intermedia TaxID=1963864 RepID=A0A6B2L825_9EUKA